MMTNILMMTMMMTTIWNLSCNLIDKADDIGVSRVIDFSEKESLLGPSPRIILLYVNHRRTIRQHRTKAKRRAEQNSEYTTYSTAYTTAFIFHLPLFILVYSALLYILYLRHWGDSDTCFLEVACCLRQDAAIQGGLGLAIK
jgi:hypothetical protein